MNSVFLTLDFFIHALKFDWHLLLFAENSRLSPGESGENSTHGRVIVTAFQASGALLSVLHTASRSVFLISEASLGPFINEATTARRI